MNADWQSWAAAAIVAITAAAFLYRALRKKRGRSRCEECSCSKK